MPRAPKSTASRPGRPSRYERPVIAPYELDIAGLLKEQFPGGVQQPVLPGYKVDPLCWITERTPWIEDKRQGLVPFAPYPYQEAVIKLWWEGGAYVVEKSRQMGISTALTVAIAHSLLYAHEAKGVPLHCHLIANKESTALNLLVKVKLALSRCLMTPEERACLAGHDVGTNTDAIRFWTDTAHAYVRAHTSAESASRSFDGNAALLEEFAFMESPIGIWKTVAAMLDIPGSSLWLVSTPNGPTYHQELCDRAQNEKDFRLTYLPFDWRAHPDRDEAWKQEQLSLIGPTTFSVEHELHRMGYGESAIHLSAVDAYAAEVEYLGPRPLPGHRYAKGFDLAGPGKDLCVFTAVDITSKQAQVVCQEEYPQLEIDQKARAIEDFHNRWPGPSRIDGSGDPTFMGMVCKRCRGMIPVRFTGGKDVSSTKDLEEGLTWENAPRERMFSALCGNLETGRLIVHREHFPKLHKALATAVRYAMTKAGTLMSANKTKRLGEFPDFFDSAMLANAQLMGRSRDGAERRKPVSLRSSTRLKQLRETRW